MRQAGGVGFVPVSVDSVPLDYREAGDTQRLQAGNGVDFCFLEFFFQGQFGSGERESLLTPGEAAPGPRVWGAQTKVHCTV